jgi:hypothetical protein
MQVHLLAGRLHTAQQAAAAAAAAAATASRTCSCPGARPA